MKVNAQRVSYSYLRKMDIAVSDNFFSSSLPIANHIYKNIFS